jgi:hypothetical protein
MIDYDFAILRVVPRVQIGTYVNIGVMMHARTEEFLALRAEQDLTRLAALVPELDVQLLARYLDTWTKICDGDPASGPVALLPPSERFHWLTAPRSDVLQSSPVHEGVCSDLRTEIERLYRAYT